jgi:hypothetical protein
VYAPWNCSHCRSTQRGSIDNQGRSVRIQPGMPRSSRQPSTHQPHQVLSCQVALVLVVLCRSSGVQVSYIKRALQDADYLTKQTRKGLSSKPLPHSGLVTPHWETCITRLRISCSFVSRAPLHLLLCFILLLSHYGIILLPHAPGSSERECQGLVDCRTVHPVLDWCLCQSPWFVLRTEDMPNIFPVPY